MRRALIGAVAVAVTALSACSGGGGWTHRVGSGAGSCPRQFQAAGDPSANDVASAPQGDATTSDFVPGTTDQVLQNWPAVAVVRVVSRASARYDSTADQSTAQAPGRGHGSGGTVRPTQFAVERRLKGDPPDCLTLDVPGGTANGRQQTSDAYPVRYNAGDRMVAFLSSGPEGWSAGLLLGVAPDCSVHLPFGGHETENADTWTLDAEASAPPTTAPCPAAAGASP